MAEKTDTGAVAPKQAKAVTAKAAGKIVFNPNLGAWRCINAQGRLMLSIGSLELATKAYPDFTVIEKE